MGFLSDLFKPTQKDVTTTGTKQTTPFGQAQPALDSSFGLLQEGLDQGRFTGQRTAGFDPAQTAGLNQTINTAQQGTPLTGAASDQALRSINFQNPASQNLGDLGQFGFAGAQGLQDIGQNPFQSQAFQQGINRLGTDTLDFLGRANTQTAGDLSSVGRFRGRGGGVDDLTFGRNAEQAFNAFGRGAADLGNQALTRQAQANQQLFQGGFQGFQGQGSIEGQSEALRQQAVAGASGARQFEFDDFGRQIAAGGQFQDQRQRELDAALADFNDPFQRGAAGLNAVLPAASTFGEQGISSTTPTFGPSVGSQLIGGAATAAGFLLGGPPGAAAGSALGSIFSGGGSTTPFQTGDNFGFGSGGQSGFNPAEFNR